MITNIKNSVIISWFAQQITSVDIFSNSLILRFILKVFKKISSIFYNKRMKIITLTVLLVVVGYIGWQFSWVYCLVAILLFPLSILIWKRTDLGIVLLILSFTLTPKIYIGGTIIPLRIDDLLLVIITVITLFKISLNKLELKAIPLDIPILFFLGIIIISTFRGFFIHTIDKPIINLLYVSKIMEFFLIFYLITYNIRNEKQTRLCLGSIILSCIIVSLIGIWEHFNPLDMVAYPNYYRLYERGIFYGESNHFGGYFVFLMGIAGGFILFASNLKRKIYWLAFSLLVFFPLLWTYSRQSYLALIGVILVLPLFKKNKRNLIMVIFILMILLLSLVSVPSRIKDRLLEIKEALLSKNPYQSSFAFRLIRWQEALSSFREYPFLGTGLGSRHRAFYESNHIMLLSESGILGYGLFSSILFVILHRGIRLFRSTEIRFIKCFSAGFIAGFIGLILHSFICNTFMITRIAGPFWITVGLLFSLDKFLCYKNG